METDKFQDVDYKFSLWGMRPNSYKKGANVLIFLAIYNIGSFFFLHIFLNVFIGFLFGILAWMVYKNFNFALYVGTFIWSLGIILNLISIAMYPNTDTASTNPTMQSGILLLSVLLFWALTKSTSIYHKFYLKCFDK